MDLGFIGLGRMGANMVRRLVRNGHHVVAYNRTVSKVDEFLAKEAKGTKVVGAHSVEEMVKKLKRPRRVMMLVKAGQPVDGPAREPVVGPTGEPATGPTDQLRVGPSGEPAVRKGGRLGSPAQ